MKKAIVVHGWGGNPSGDWFPWLKQELEDIGYEVVVPEMPDTMHPKIDVWIAELGKAAGSIDDETILIGHSIGTQTILRFVEHLPSNIRIGKIVLVAAWLHLTNETWDEDYTTEIAKPWVNTKINFEAVKQHCMDITFIQSDNDPYVPTSDIEVFREKLSAKIIMLKNAGHISAESGFSQLHEVMELIQ